MFFEKKTQLRERCKRHKIKDKREKKRENLVFDKGGGHIYDTHAQPPHKE
jgi:hypothetical protein